MMTSTSVLAGIDEAADTETGLARRTLDRRRRDDRRFVDRRRGEAARVIVTSCSYSITERIQTY